MAEDARVQFQAHERTYGSFLTLLKFGGVASFVVAFIVVLIISS